MTEYRINGGIVKHASGPSKVFSVRLDHQLRCALEYAIETQPLGDESVQEFIKEAVFDRLIFCEIIEVDYEGEDPTDSREWYMWIR